jgi:hypothetical protein
MFFLLLSGCSERWLLTALTKRVLSLREMKALYFGWRHFEGLFEGFLRVPADIPPRLWYLVASSLGFSTRKKDDDIFTAVKTSCLT